MADHEKKSTNIMAEGAMDIVAVYFFFESGKKRKKCKSQTRFCNAECCVKHANDNKGQGIRANSGKSEVRYDYYDVYNRLQFVHTSCS